MVKSANRQFLWCIFSMDAANFNGGGEKAAAPPLIITAIIETTIINSKSISRYHKLQRNCCHRLQKRWQISHSTMIDGSITSNGG
jgi:hypothetical protein